MTSGRLGTADNAKRAVEMGVNFIILTGNPTMVFLTLQYATHLREINTVVGDKLMLIAGKMHASGILGESAENIITKHDIQNLYLPVLT